MNIKNATEADKIKALAELDGWLDVMEYTFDYDWMGEKGKHKQWLGRNTTCLQDLKPLKPYLTSYDAIIPLIQKLGTDTLLKVQVNCLPLFGKFEFQCTPEQLSNAVLILTGKFDL